VKNIQKSSSRNDTDELLAAQKRLADSRVECFCKTAKQCKNRWNQFLDPFSKKRQTGGREDMLIVSLVMGARPAIYYVKRLLGLSNILPY
jgi:hypothetical protein